MKTIYITGVFICLIQFAFAQCNNFYPMKANEKFQYEIYDKKDKVTLKTNQWFKSISGSGSSVKGIQVQEMIDAKNDKMLTTSESEWICENGTVHFTLNTMNFGGDQQASMGTGVAMDVTGDKMDLPTELKVGQTFKDLNYTVKMTVNGMVMMNRPFHVTERKVETMEDVTTTAGTFSCYKITYTTTSTGGMGSGTIKTITWVAKNVGLVKAENYNDKGAFMGKQVLSKVGG